MSTGGCRAECPPKTWVAKLAHCNPVPELGAPLRHTASWRFPVTLQLVPHETRKERQPARHGDHREPSQVHREGEPGMESDKQNNGQEPELRGPDGGQHQERTKEFESNGGAAENPQQSRKMKEVVA